MERYLMMLGVVWLAVHGVTAKLQIVTTFEDKAVMEGGVVVLDCQFNQRPQYRMWNYRSASSSQGFRDLSWCPGVHSNCTLKPEFAAHAELATPNNGSLVIARARRRNDGVYQCKAFHGSSEARNQLRLTVLVPPGPPRLAANNSSPLVDDVLALDCSTSGGNPAPRLRWRWLLASSTLRPGLQPQTSPPAAVFGRSRSRVLARVSEADHLAVVTCEAANSAGNLTSPPLTLRVRRAAGKAQLSVSRAAPLERSEVTVNCSSAGGNPQPALVWRWTRADGSDRLLPAPTVLPADRPFGRTVSQLQLQVLHLDDAATLACNADNGVGHSDAAILRLSVRYTPRIAAFPHSPLAVREDQRIAVDCRVAGNPTPDVAWSRDGAAVHDVAATSLVFARVNRANAGVYKCSASNTAGRAEVSLELRVLYPPSILVPNTLVVREGEKLLLQCRVRAYPRADVHWLAPGGSPVEVAGHDFQISRVQRRHAGRYECVARNRLVPTDGAPSSHTARNGTDVLVKYLPSSPTVSLLPSSSVVVNSDVTLLCRANSKDPGYPPPLLQWRRLADDALLSNNGSLRLARASLADSGRYRCTPRNDVGAGPVREVELQVEQPPQWLARLTPAQRTLSLSHEDHDLSVFCAVRGKPLPRVKWSRNGVPIAGSGDLAILFRISAREQPVDGDARLGYQVKSVLTWAGSKRRGLRNTALRPDDNGVYRCEASNHRGKIVSSLRLVVQYPPMFVDAVTIVAADLKAGAATLSCPVSAQPAPVDTQWFLSDGRAVTDSSVPAKFTVRREEPQTERRLYTTLLVIRQLTADDLRLYHCRTRNHLGNNTLTVQLRNQSRPEAPARLRLQSGTWESAFLTWTPGFDGGFAQTFELRLRWAAGEDRRKALTGDRYNLTALLPNTSYSLQLRAVNRLGAGPPAPLLLLDTEPLFIPRVQQLRVDVANMRLSFTAPPGYCVRVDVSRDSGRSWLPFRDCLRPQDESERLSSTAEDYRAALCLSRRRDVCSAFVRADVSYAAAQVPMVVILAVAVACAVLIVVLFAVLLFFCLRRRPRRKQLDAAEVAHRRPQAVTINPYAPTPPASGPALHASPPGKPYALVLPTAGAPTPAYENGAATFAGEECGRGCRASPKPATTPHSHSSQDPLLCEPPPYSLPQPGLELQPIGARESEAWARDLASPSRSLTLSRTSGLASPVPSATLPLAGGTCPRQAKKVIYEVVV